MYNFKKNVKLYIVENGNKHSIEVYSDVSASQTFDEQSNKLKTLHDLNALHESASITKANVGNFSFTTPIHNTTVTPIVLTLGTTYSSGTVSFFDIYIESDNVIYKLEKAVIESMTFNIERNAVLTVSISGSAAKLLLHSTLAAPVAIPGTLVVVASKTYAAVKGLNVSIAGTTLSSIAAVNMDIANEVSWLNYNTMQNSLAGNIAYPSNYVVQGRTLSGSVTEFLTTENISTITDTSTIAPLVLDIYDGNTVPILKFNLPSVVFTRRLNMEEIFNRVYDFRLNSNSTNVKPIYKGV